MSKIINLSNCFPEGNDGRRVPLPKQRTFFDAALSPKDAKYLAYFGGVGSGKSLILCISVLTQAVIYGGDYVIARQFMPELRTTTLKTFLEVCPKELILEHRIADAEIRLKSASGKPAVIYFRGLDEPDKLRSMNLSGFGIDEASQVSEEAFLLLQGRLRNKLGLRKGLLVGNPAGHDWVYHYFIKQDLFRDEEVKKQFKMIIAPSTENIHLPDGYVKSMLSTYSEQRIQREIMGSFDAFEGMVYTEFRRDVHVIKPFRVAEEWTRVIGVDHGYRNPTCWLWGAVDYDGNLYIYREFYQREWLIKQIVKGHETFKKPGVLELMKTTDKSYEKISGIYIDPSTRAHRGTVGANGKDVYSDWDAYLEYLPNEFGLICANNDKTVGIDRVKSYLKVEPKSNKPKLFIFDTCPNLIEELSKYRYQELATSQTGKQNEKEDPRKVDDHAVDALRYLVMSRPELPKEDADIWKRVKYQSLEGSLLREIQALKVPKTKDPFGI